MELPIMGIKEPTRKIITANNKSTNAVKRMSPLFSYDDHIAFIHSSTLYSKFNIKFTITLISVKIYTIIFCFAHRKPVNE